MSSVVMLSYYFPPLVGIASERAAAFARHLPEAGWNPIVIAPRRGFYHRVSSQEVIPGSLVRTSNPELSRLMRRGYAAATGASYEDSGTVVSVASAATATRLSRFVREALYVPDAQVGWIPFARQAAARELSRLPEGTVLFSTSVPFSAHLAAMWSRRRRTPWVAEFRDPWTEAHALLRPSMAWRRRLDRSIHRRILDAASRIVVTSAGLRSLLLGAFPELDPGRVDVVMNGFEPGPPGRPAPPAEPLQIVYAGTVASGEDIVPMLQAIESVHERQPHRVRLTIVGPPGPWQDSYARHAAWLELAGLHTPEQARSFVRNASALFLLQSHNAYAATLPGKLWEYMGARRPILAAVPASWPMVDLLRAHADLRLASNSAPALAMEIDRLLAEHTRGALQAPRVPEETVRPLQRREQARRLAAVLSRAVAS